MGALPSPQRIQNARAALLAVRARLLAEDPAIADDARLMIDCLDGEAGDALDIIRAMVRACRTAEAQAAGAKADAEAYAEPLRERSHRLAARAKRIRTALLGVCEALNQPKWEDACFTLSVGTTPPALVVIDETLIPSEYVRTRREIDMPAALAALKNGKDVPGACLGNGAPRLTIRDR